MKAAGYTCACCGLKQSRAKGREAYVECHHLEGIGNWDKVIDLIFEEILCHPSKLSCLCPECHVAEGPPFLKLNELPGAKRNRLTGNDL
jgi:hypothetical protein